MPVQREKNLPAVPPRVARSRKKKFAQIEYFRAERNISRIYGQQQMLSHKRTKALRLAVLHTLRGLMYGVVTGSENLVNIPSEYASR